MTQHRSVAPEWFRSMGPSPHTPSAAPARRSTLPAPGLSVGPELSHAEFLRFQEHIQKSAGIFLSEAKRALLIGRLSRRLRTLGLTSFAEYYRRVVEQGDAEEHVQMIDAICTNETHFFREPRHFAFLDERLLPLWRDQARAGERERRIRIWSAACSTGEEPFSLAMLLADHFPSGWDCEVLATDLSSRVLDAARSATWSLDRAKDIPERLLKRFMLRGVEDQTGKMRACPELRAMVKFATVNLTHDNYPVAGDFDLVFCRNVLIYFQAPDKLRVIRNLASHVKPGGYFFLGHAETVTGMTGLRSVMPTVYERT